LLAPTQWKLAETTDAGPVNYLAVLTRRPDGPPAR
jgi:hypothetical protein